MINKRLQSKSTLVAESERAMLALRMLELAESAPSNTEIQQMVIDRLIALAAEQAAATSEALAGPDGEMARPAPGLTRRCYGYPRRLRERRKRRWAL